MCSQKSRHEDYEVIELEDLGYLTNWIENYKEKFDTIVSHCHLGNFNDQPIYGGVPDEAGEFL